MWLPQKRMQSSDDDDDNDDILNLKNIELSLSLPGTKKTTATKRSGFSDAQLVVGWPPVRSKRRKSWCSKYVKVGVDGAPYLRKVDLQMYESYEHLLTALESMFCCLSSSSSSSSVICGRNYNYLNEMDTEYMPTYEDNDGDWMLLGDVPWEMFVESCKRIRLMVKSEDVGLGPRTTASKSSKSTDSS